MARALRIEYAGAWYHVLNRGRRRENIFFCEEDYKEFFKILGEISRLYKIEIHAYSLMPNHYHLLIHTPKGMLSRSMRHLNGVYTQNINRRYNKDGSLFRGRFKSILIEKESYLTELVRYIHRNPYRAKLEEEVGQHKWTSHCTYMEKEKSPLWLRKEEVLKQFSEYTEQAKRELDAFVKEKESENLTRILRSLKWPAILGGEKFKAQIREKLRGELISKSEVPQYKESMGSLSAEEVIKTIESESGEKGIFEQKRSLQHFLKRKALAYICKEYLYIPTREICRVLGEISYAALSKQFYSAAEEIKRKEGCYQDFQNIAKILKLTVKT